MNGNKGFKIEKYLDTRRQLKNGLYPLKLRAWNTNTQEQKLFKTPFAFSIADYTNIESTKTKKSLQDDKIKISEYFNQANKIASEIVPFNFTTFESFFGRKKVVKGDLIGVFEERITEMEANGQIKNATGYKTSLKAFKKFIKPNDWESVDKFIYTDLDLKRLLAYKKHLEGYLSISSVGSYLRPLQAIYNIVFDDNVNHNIKNPFKDKKFTVPSATKVNKALDVEDLISLMQLKAKTEQQSKARDFWFLAFYLNGLNINDIVRIKNSEYDAKNKMIIKFRNKTLKSTEKHLQPIVVQLSDEAIELINKYKSDSSKPDDYLFTILDNTDDEKAIVRKIGNFNRFINQHLKKLVKDTKIDNGISPIFSRHTFATRALNESGNTNLIKDFLGHKDIRTTHKYASNLMTAEKKQVLSKVFDLSNKANDIHTLP